MSRRDIIVIGASAGGLAALKTVLSGLPRDIPASVFAVLHLSAQSRGLLPRMLAQATDLPVVEGTDEAVMKRGCVYVAPPDMHMAVEARRLRVVRGPKENRHRPSVDVLFRSAARAYGPRVIGVVLTGALDDGTAGLAAIKACGGIAIVQDPADAFNPGMPASALENVSVDQCLPLAEIGTALVAATRSRTKRAGKHRVPARIKLETDFAMMERGFAQMDDWGKPSHLSCPSCNGTLWELEEGRSVRFRCHTGHAFSGASLLLEQSEALEEALYTAARALTEKAALTRRLAKTYAARFPELGSLREAQARKFDEASVTIRSVLVDRSKSRRKKASVKRGALESSD